MQMNCTTSDVSRVMDGDIPQALYIDSNLSRAMYSPFCNLTYHQLIRPHMKMLTRFLIRSIIDKVPSDSHCPISPVLYHPSSVMVSLVSSSCLKYLLISLCLANDPKLTPQRYWLLSTRSRLEGDPRKKRILGRVHLQ